MGKTPARAAALIVLFILIGVWGVPGFAALWLRADHARELEVVAREEATELGQQEQKARELAEWKVYYSQIALRGTSITKTESATPTINFSSAIPKSEAGSGIYCWREITPIL